MDSGHSMVISVMAKDRPGIVAEATGGISQLGGNLADLRQSVLCGYFTMILVADFPLSVSAEEVEELLRDKTSSKVAVVIQEDKKETSGSSEKPEQIYILSAVGLDRAGLVEQVARFCFERGVNILDIASRVEDGRYTMMLQIDLAGIHSLEIFRRDLFSFGKASGLALVLQHNDIFQATNEVQR